MEQHLILVRRISHLTDARYFAAMGVEWMSIVLSPDPVTFAFWHTIRDWVEGVKLAAEVDVRDEEWLARVVIEAEPHGIVTSDWNAIDIPEQIELFYSIRHPDQSEIPPAGKLILPYGQPSYQETVPQGYSPDRIFLEADWTVPLLKKVLSSGYTGGICFQGGEEKEKGMRDYAEMDEMLGRLGK